MRAKELLERINKNPEALIMVWSLEHGGIVDALVDTDESSHDAIVLYPYSVEADGEEKC